MILGQDGTYVQVIPKKVNNQDKADSSYNKSLTILTNPIALLDVIPITKDETSILGSTWKIMNILVL